MDNLFSLQGRTALVTGGSRGIGAMIAEGFLKAGAKVYISARKAAQCEEAARNLSQFGQCVALPADASGASGARELAARYLGLQTSLDILVNNAGATWGAPFEEFPEGGWDKIFDINLKSPFFLVQALHGALTSSASADRPSKVINISSIDGLSVNSLETYSYAASKAALMHLTRRLALRLIKDNIVVSAVAPGAFATDMNYIARNSADSLTKEIPARRIGSSADMAGAAVYLASRAGDYAVGTTLVVDGGVSLTRLACD